MRIKTPKAVEFAADVSRQILESSVGLTEKSVIAPDRALRSSEVEVGGTPSETVYSENKLNLVRYESDVPADRRKETPILVVYALVNRQYILDLQPDRSVVRRLLEAGYDVYMIDWGEPSTLDRGLTLDDYVNRYMDNCVSEVLREADADEVTLFGYCMGGTMSAMYAGIHPERVRNLVLMASGLCFDGGGGLLEHWGDEDYFDSQKVTDAFGNAPAELLDLTFVLMEPMNNTVSKYMSLYGNLEDEEFVENFARMESWLNDGIDVAGATYTEFVRKIYQDNLLQENRMYVGDMHVELDEIDMPVLQIVGEYDHLIPPEASLPFSDAVASEDTEVFKSPVGHIGLSVSSRAHKNLWPQVCNWLAERDSGKAGVEAYAEDDIPEHERRVQSLQRVKGIGPTYAERLVDEDIGINELVNEPATDVADAAEVSADRARDWANRAEDVVENGSV
jgi:polyhydroxyalkanoate synthase